MSENPINIFKDYLIPKAKYAGGKGKAEVADKIKDKKIWKLSSNENILGSSPKAIDAIAQSLNALSEYPERTDKSLRHALSAFYKNALTPDQFITENSGVAMLELIQRAFLGSGLEVIVSNPAFKPYLVFSQKLDAKVIDVPLVGDNFHLNIEGILNAITDKTRLIFVTSPNNPTGTHLPKAQVTELVNKLPDHVVMVYDEVYYQFADAEDYTTALPYVMEGKNVIAVNSFSKAYGLAGLRVGYAYSSEKLAKYVSNARRPFMISSLGMNAAMAALKDTAFIEKTVQLIRTEKEFLYQALDALQMKYWKTQGNFILIKPEMNDKVFEEKMMMEGIMVRPVANFGAPECIRVTIGTREANEAYITALKKVMSS